MAGQLQASTFTGGIAHLFIGPNEILFNVHLILLCSASPYFTALLKKTPNTYMKVLATDPDVFAELVAWLYKGSLCPDLSPDFTLEFGLPKVLFLLKLWRTAYGFEMHELQVAALEAVERLRTHPHPHSDSNAAARKFPRKYKNGGILSAETVDFVYAHTEAGDLARELVVDVWFVHSCPEAFALQRRGFPVEFVLDLCELLIEQLPALENGKIKESDGVGDEGSGGTLVSCSDRGSEVHPDSSASASGSRRGSGAQKPQEPCRCGRGLAKCMVSISSRFGYGIE
ncbi:BTB/POZ domain-containing protein [Aspergillus mulundensis]|uniref:BTB domain-containing protein n=1 Tax=Aspergillus mulundensis TaxID=1810919 RepID=A0A3D8REV8_9EURO|nr:hypothetical protein DSM5745_07761 [Aspergillus mulundensis]RDW72589.1 hypothetical protein DSM5745_07761 [Aspergillus mulundensis]